MKLFKGMYFSLLESVIDTHPCDIIITNVDLRTVEFEYVKLALNRATTNNRTKGINQFITFIKASHKLNLFKTLKNIEKE